jgi:hypothetical protein
MASREQLLHRASGRILLLPANRVDNLVDHADSIGAVAGQFADASYGAPSIPPEWPAKLAWREKIEKLAGALFVESSPI